MVLKKGFEFWIFFSQVRKSYICITSSLIFWVSPKSVSLSVSRSKAVPPHFPHTPNNWNRLVLLHRKFLSCLQKNSKGNWTLEVCFSADAFVLLADLVEQINASTHKLLRALWQYHYGEKRTGKMKSSFSKHRNSVTQFALSISI